MTQPLILTVKYVKLRHFLSLKFERVSEIEYHFLQRMFHIINILEYRCLRFLITNIPLL